MTHSVDIDICVDICVQLFGISSSANVTNTNGMTTSNDVNPVSPAASVFALSAKRTVGEAAGNRHRRDVVVQMRRVDEVDCYLTVTQRGIVSTWNNKVTIIIVVVKQGKSLPFTTCLDIVNFCLVYTLSLIHI